MALMEQTLTGDGTLCLHTSPMNKTSQHDVENMHLTLMIKPHSDIQSIRLAGRETTFNRA